MVSATIVLSTLRQCNGCGIGLVMERSQVWLPAVTLSCCSSGQVVYSYVPRSV